LDVQIAAWKSRDLSAHTYPYIFVDALYENVRRKGAVVSEGMLITCGVREDGKREVLDVAVADTESAAAYNDLFGSLRERGLFGVRLVVSDAHAGLKAAIKRYFQGASWQRCQVHFHREAAMKVSFKRRRELSADILEVFSKTTRAEAMKKACDVADKWRDVAPRVASMIDDGIEECLSALAFPEKHRKRIRTNNALERLNKEIRRRDQVIEVFPNEASAMRLVCALCMETSEEWLSGREYLDMSLLDIDDEPVFVAIEPIGSMTQKKAS
jgi:transposase-like protein